MCGVVGDMIKAWIIYPYQHSFTCKHITVFTLCFIFVSALSLHKVVMAMNSMT